MTYKEALQELDAIAARLRAMAARMGEDLTPYELLDLIEEIKLVVAAQLRIEKIALTELRKEFDNAHAAATLSAACGLGTGPGSNN